MEKFAAFAQARSAFRERRWRAFARSSALFASDQIGGVALRLWRERAASHASLLAVLLGFAFLYGAMGGIETIAETSKGQGKRPYGTPWI